MIAVGVKQNPNLYTRLFWLFDMNGDGIIDQKELLVVLEWFKENSFEERLKSNNCFEEKINKLR